LGIDIDDEELVRIQTIGDLLKIEGRTRKNRLTTRPESMALDAWRSRESVSYRALGTTTAKW
jgi:hypothetical protein